MVIIDSNKAFRTVDTAFVVADTPADSSAVRIVGGNIQTPMYAMIRYWAASVSASTGTLIFTTRRSADDSTYYNHSDGAADVIGLTTTAKSGVFFLPIAHPDDYTKVRAALTGTNGTVKWNAYLVQSPVGN